jgi:hypothetical protein
MRWPWAKKPLPPRIHELLERLIEVERGQIYLEQQLDKQHFTIMALKRASKRDQQLEEAIEDAPGPTIVESDVSRHPPLRGTGPLRNLRGF